MECVTLVNSAERAKVIADAQDRPQRPTESKSRAQSRSPPPTPLESSRSRQRSSDARVTEDADSCIAQSYPRAEEPTSSTATAETDNNPLKRKWSSDLARVADPTHRNLAVKSGSKHGDQSVALVQPRHLICEIAGLGKAQGMVTFTHFTTMPRNASDPYATPSILAASGIWRHFHPGTRGLGSQNRYHCGP